MQKEINYDGVNYKFEDYKKYSKRLVRFDGEKFNQSNICRKILIEKGLNPDEINKISGNIKLATMLYNHINNIKKGEKKANASNSDLKETSNKSKTTKGKVYSSKSDMDAEHFYQFLEHEFDEFARINGITNPEKYYELTDFNDNSVYRSLYNLNLDDERNKLNYLFAQFAYHVNNGQNTPFVSFNEAVELRASLHCNFDVEAFLTRYENMNPGDMYNLFRQLEKGTSKRKDANVKRYIKLMLNVAHYLRGKTRDEVINQIINATNAGDPKDGIKFVLNHIMKNDQDVALNVGVKLTCDLMKELDPYFSFLCKPDVHVRDFVGAYFGLNFAPDDNGDYACIYKFIELLNDIKVNHSDLTGYKLDRMIYILGSGKFFLDGVTFGSHINHKKGLLKTINPHC